MKKLYVVSIALAISLIFNGITLIDNYELENSRVEYSNTCDAIIASDVALIKKFEKALGIVVDDDCSTESLKLAANTFNYL